MMQLRQYTASHRVPGNGNRASDSQLPVRRGVCGPWWERVSCAHRDVRAAQGAAWTDDQARTRGAISCLLSSEGFVALAAAWRV